MTLARFLLSLSSPDQETIRRRLDILDVHIAVTKEFVRNVDAECRLPHPIWQELADAILGTGDDPTDLQAALTAVFQQHTLEGGSLARPWPHTFGRAVTPDSFCDTLLKRGYRKTRLGAQRFLSRLVRCGPDLARKRLERKYLAVYNMWATYDPKDTNQDPFRVAFPDADEIRSLMGLEHPEGEDLILFVYRLPRGAHPKFPTVADAYAGHWNMRFRPSRPDSPCGYTLPWKRDHPPSPEVVHRKITGRTLLLKVRRAHG